ncbi:MAG: leucine--tRNA ligase [Alphaproteobacteria bacterium]|nr:leucine--tRNA ligase [Alphaproteobacteria bacterium]MBN2674990.1 leucine--tRNA ligase [Alphaproteobacteria bacterium]
MSENIKKIHDREAKWQKKWRATRSFVPKNDGVKQKYYNLFEFPFPSGNGLHVGHLVPYVSMDIMARYRRMQGLDVLYPMGLDSMGIAAEHYAKKIGKSPAESVEQLTEIFNRDVSKVGLSIDPESFLRTSDSKFIKWTQWIFIQLFNAGLAYKAEYPMNWCPSCQTSFTNEELDGLDECPRCHGKIEQRNKLQWMMAITKYADRLVDDLELVDYSDRVKTGTINWVGRSFGAEVDFQVGDDVMTVYTTRVDTIFGATFCVIAPEHKLVAKLLSENKIQNASDVKKYIEAASAKDKFERTNESKEKTGVKLDSITAKNPFNCKDIPIFVADYVLADYGFGAIMAVPAHDQRDYDFAKKFDLPIIQVLDNGDISEHAQEGDGLHINSEYLNGLNKDDAIKVALEYGNGFARSAKQYKMRDWAFSRQMYWGEPIPLVYCPEHGWVPVPENQLPLELPYLTDYTPTENGEGPLARATDWVNTTCPVCGGPAKRETDTMPGWAGSSWYFLRYLDPNNDSEFCSREQMDKWMPVDHYNGPMEHVTKHLIYSRFWYKALYDLGFVPGVEPYKKRTLNGLMMAPDGRKMSKSLGNLVSSNDVVERSGADSCRMTILFLGPFGANINWSEETLVGVSRFLKRVENFADNLTDDELNDEQERLVNQLILDMTDRVENMQFNTAISAMMEFINAFVGKMPRRAYEILIQVLNPFAPHLTEEIWEKLGHKDMLVFEPWPIYDETKLGKKTMTIVVSVNGKRRADFVVPVESEEKDLVATAKSVGEKYLTGEIVKTIVVPGKMVNFVIK